MERAVSLCRCDLEPILSTARFAGCVVVYAGEQRRWQERSIVRMLVHATCRHHEWTDVFRR